MWVKPARFRGMLNSRLNGVAPDIAETTVQVRQIANDPVVGLLEPDRARVSIQAIHLSCRKAFHRLQPFLQCDAVKRPRDQMSMVRHDNERRDIDLFVVPVQNGVVEDGTEAVVVEIARAQTLLGPVLYTLEDQFFEGLLLGADVGFDDH